MQTGTVPKTKCLPLQRKDIINHFESEEHKWQDNLEHKGNEKYSKNIWRGVVKLKRNNNFQSDISPNISLFSKQFHVYQTMWMFQIWMD